MTHDLVDTLRTSEQLYRSLVETSRDMIALVDLGGTVLMTNRRAAELLGFHDTGELIGTNVFEIIAQEDRARAYENMRKRATLEVPTGTNTEYLLNRRDGTAFLAEINSSILVDNCGNAVALTVTARDVTERRRVEEERARLLAREQVARVRAESAEGMLRTVIEASPLAIVTLDVAGNVSSWNRSAERMFGWSESEVLGKPAPTIPADQLQASEEIRERVLTGELVTGLERRRQRKDGSWIDVSISTAALHDQSGQLLGTVLVADDITERKQVEKAQQEMVHQRDLFLSSAAHDLKNPLTTIKGFTQILQRRVRRLDIPDADGLLEGLERVNATAGRMTNLINQLLDVSRIQMGQPLELDTEEVDLLELVRHEVSEQQETTDIHRLVVETSLPELVGMWDPSRLQRVLANVLSNAIKYSPQDGEILIRVEREGRDAVFSVQDPGLGIPDSDLPYIFERFYRAGNVAEQISGTGIGLVGARQIVEQHGGQINANSREGEGATFTVRLPIHGIPDSHPTFG